MIFRPVRPVSPTGPPMTNRPVGLMKIRVSLSTNSLGTTGLITYLIRSFFSFSSFTSSSCWAEMTMASMRLTWSPSYSTVTWVLPSGRR